MGKDATPLRKIAHSGPRWGQILEVSVISFLPLLIHWFTAQILN